jgi:fructose-bisphosphate aldolase, class I
MGAGRRYRLGRLFGPDGRALVLPVDHGLMLGRVAGLEDPVRLVRELLALDCDGLLLSPGMVRRTVEEFARRDAPARLMTLDTFFRAPDESGSGAGLVAAVEDAARLGVDAVKVLMAWNVSSPERQATLSRIADVVRRAAAYDLPVMVEPLVIDEPRTPASVATEGDAARIAMELGADIIKIGYPGPELMEAWTAELGVPLVILGGPRSGDPEGVLRLAAEAMDHGARGIVIGRNVWQREPAVTRDLMHALFRITHGPAQAGAAQAGAVQAGAVRAGAVQAGAAQPATPRSVG